MKFSFAVFAVLFLLAGCGKEQTAENKPHSIILLIGDGMGVSHVYSGIMAQGSLNIERCLNIGFQKTHSANRKITDSGASGTAIATGSKTNNGSIAVDPSGGILETILEHAESSGKSTGLISTSTITHATPASFIAHNVSRGEYEAIAADFLAQEIEVIIGGGRNHFSEREDGKDLLDKYREMGYQVASTLDEIDNSSDQPIVVLTDSLAMPPSAMGRGDLLPQATELAIERLSGNPDGFFLMVEGSQIDWAAHANNSDYLVSEMLDFDLAVGEAIDFAESNPGVLVIVTADHETGGFALSKPEGGSEASLGGFATEGHTAVMVPVFAYGPGAEKFRGIYDNTEIFDKMMSLLELP